MTWGDFGVLVWFLGVFSAIRLLSSVIEGFCAILGNYCGILGALRGFGVILVPLLGRSLGLGFRFGVLLGFGLVFGLCGLEFLVGLLSGLRAFVVAVVYCGVGLGFGLDGWLVC